MKTILILLTFILIHVSSKRHSKNLTHRIVGGTYTSITNYPYQVVLEYWNPNKTGYEFLCGGSLISVKHVLTAGHCCKDMQMNYYLVKVGMDGWENPMANQMSYIERIFIHPAYYKTVNNQPINDIAVLKTSSTFSENQNVRVIPLPPYGSHPYNQYLCVISGFGKTKTDDSQPSPYLLRADVKIITNDVCRTAIKNLVPNSNPVIDDNIFCTMDTPTKGSCSGDSGGPLMQFGQLIGVISFGVTPCELNNNPTVYTRAGAYVDWINNMMQL